MGFSSSPVANLTVRPKVAILWDSTAKMTSRSENFKSTMLSIFEFLIQPLNCGQGHAIDVWHVAVEEGEWVGAALGHAAPEGGHGRR